MTPTQFKAFMQMLEAIRLAILANGFASRVDYARSEAEAAAARHAQQLAE